MKKSWIGLFCMILCIALITGGMGRNAFADYSRGGIEWSLWGDRLTVYGTGEMKTLLADTEWAWDSEKNAFTEAVIEDGITSIGDYALFDCYFMESVQIPESVTSIGNYAFYNCKSLKEITIPNSVTSIGNYAFYGCESLKSIAIPAGTSIGECAFDACGNIEIITTSENAPMTALGEGHSWGNLTWTLDEEGTLIIFGSGEMENWNDEYDDMTSDVWSFRPYRDKIKKAEVCEGVTSIGKYAFSNCDFLKSITIADSVTNIGDYAFSDCDSLKSITIPDSVASIGVNPFYSCKELTSINISEQNPYLEVIDGVLFSKQDKRLICHPIALSTGSYTVPEGTKVISTAAFDYTNIKTITIPGSVEIIESIPKSKPDLIISAENPYLKEIDGILIGQQDNRLITASPELSGDYTIPEGIEIIGNNAFYYCNSLKNITIPDSVNSIGEAAFSCCFSLESVTIPDGVTEIGNEAFSWCEALKSVSIPDSVTSIGYCTFAICTSLQSINFSDGITSIGNQAFVGCESLQSISIPDSVANIEYGAFGACTSLQSISIPDSVISMGDAVFGECESLQSISIPLIVAKRFDQVVGYETLPSLTSIICRIPDGVTRIEDEALWNSCITSVTIPDGVIAIGKRAFSDCRDLTSVTIPDSVIAMGDSVFEGCNDSLVVNVFRGSAAERYCEENGINHIGNQVSSVNTKGGRLSNGVYWRMDNDSDGTITIFGNGKLGNWYDLWSQSSIIKSLVIEEGITGIEYFGASGFPALTSITIPNSVTTINGNPFSACPDLYAVNISADHPTLEIVDGGLYSKQDQKLIACLSDTESFAIREGTKIIGPSAFRNCETLTSIVILDSVTIIGGGAFEHCASLKSVTIPEGVCNIRDYMFNDCYALSSVTIPDSVINIGFGAFQHCSSLKEITVPASVHIINESVFGFIGTIYSSTTVNVIPESYAEQFCQRTGIPYMSFAYVPLDKAGLSVSAKDGEASVSAGKSLQMIVAFDNPDLINKKNKNDEVIWSAGNAETGETVPAATIDAKGELKIDKSLEETVRLLVTGESASYGTKATAVITAIPVVKGIIADPAELFLYVGTEEPQTVKVFLEPASVPPVGLTWTPAKKDIVEITEVGDGAVSIKPLKAGKTDITVKEPGGKSTKVKVNVVDPVESVKLAVKGKAKADCKVNIAATLAPKTAGNKAVEYSLDVGEDIATINNKGQLSISKNVPSGTKITVTCTALGAPVPVKASVVVEVP